jgi:hypothetical protein
MDEDRYQALRGARRALLRAYLVHVAWFAAMLAFAGTHWTDGGLRFTVVLTLATVPPVLYFTVKVHRLCRAIDARAATVGWVPVLVTTFVLSPFESGLILPLKNLLVANRLLRQAAPAGAPAAHAAPDVDSRRLGYSPAACPLQRPIGGCMPKYVIERDIPGAGNLSQEDLKAISQKSCGVLSNLGPSIQWQQSYVTADKIYCVYIAPNEEMVREHAMQGGFPANRVSRVMQVIDPTTSE